ncbi:MAG: dienelactone hydrolase family protein [Gemmatimonadales bacterium]
MATPTRTSHQLDGALGPIFVDTRATTRSEPAPAVIVHHGFKGFKDYAFLPVYAERLARAGFVAVTASVSGSGVDHAGDFTRLECFAANTYSRELDDLGLLLSALQRGELGTVPPSSVGIVGHSRGGGMSLCLAHEAPAISAVVTWAGIGRVRRHTDDELAAWKRAGTISILNSRTRQELPLNYEVVEDCLIHEHGRLNIAAAAAALDRPWLQVHGTADETIPIEEARALHAAAQAELAETFWVEGADHVFGSKHPWAGASEAMEEVFNRTTQFLSRHLD